MSSVVAYFSATGTTKRAAEKLAKEKNAELYEIKPEKLYSQADLYWQDSNSRSTVEANDKSARPALADKDFPIDQYDDIYVGFPIWWYTAPRIINTFLESYDFNGKNIYPFATSGTSGYGKTNDDLKPSAPKAVWHDGFMIR